MKWVYAPCAGVVRQYSDVFQGETAPGHCLVIEILQRKQDRELVVVAPVSGVLAEIDGRCVVVDPHGSDERHPACHSIETTLKIDDPLKAVAAVGDSVKAGQVVLRGRGSRGGAAIVSVTRPHGRILASTMDTVVYTAEPLLAIAREEVDVVEIGAGGSVSRAARTLETVAVTKEVSPTASRTTGPQTATRGGPKADVTTSSPK